ncbi:phenylacetate-CoA oxygenase subunit PaaJ [Thauera sp. CAU 1555]|uniref:Phenylacetate-CoA oxygenase subunit PaaJ n=1 Tax=Thauera sedimentorum TaxID=2767595 RepID=A0ABR9BAK4_9RHOO|nr:1,2-phenylacetyl-CoA epoxidase subunit PaaD [Thauera sedimentorum]MBC9072454.1 phenylacetate-CoA oxygenase subunit PaaJ [Thauera sedimentorum]MBD8503373.1 phenylacetate-CoA oxygenase subunit PaaJ [Thauera sedimentorum]
MLSEPQAWQVLEGVPDPEIPVVSVVELGIVREIACGDDGLRVVVTPTYSGCPATEVIAESIRAALAAAGAGQVDIETRLDPAWTSDWIGEAAREKLRAYGIAPPSGTAAVGGAQPIRFVAKSQTCPHCGSTDTERLSEFGSTACKALYRCRACREPFEYFKPI